MENQRMDVGGHFYGTYSACICKTDTDIDGKPPHPFLSHYFTKTQQIHLLPILSTPVFHTLLISLGNYLHLLTHHRHSTALHALQSST
ncbi:hypothetical protein DL93DRAFT_2080251 [Clavulina sp. PMI_390]|nr:hypothetical protein DL93DRAFT_2080251 [Clavulina sp. PMI_390]